MFGGGVFMSNQTVDWGKRYLLFEVTEYSGGIVRQKMSQLIGIGEVRKPFLRRTSARNVRFAETRRNL